MDDGEDTSRFANDAYSWEGLTGWKSYRMLRPFRGMYHDVRRRLPYYWSDIRDGFNYRTMAGTVRIFFVNLLPAIAFELDMLRQTGGYFGINEALLSSALAAFVFGTFACQPLTVVGITGLISLFNYTIYDIAKDQGIANLYPQFIAWVSIWAAITHWLAAIFNLCDYMRYITDFSSNSFGSYVSIIYMIKGVEELVASFSENGLAAGYLSVVIALCFWATVTFLEFLGSTALARGWVRKLLSDFAYPIATIFWTGFSHIPGRIKDTNLPRVPHTRAFYPTVDRPWAVDFWNLPVKWVFVALPIGILLTLLFYYDHNVSSLGAQARHFPLKKPAGFHWDFFLLGCTCFVGGVIGIPLPNGLVPQAPVHTDSLTEYRDNLAVTKEKDEDSQDDDAIIHHHKRITAVKVQEQRLSEWLMSLAFIGCMTGPLLTVLHTIPTGLIAGVFFVVGFGGIPNFNITRNLIYCITEKRFVDPGDLRTTLNKWRILYFTMFQILGVGFSVAVSQTIAAIGFPVIIISLIPLRWCLLPRIFTERELLILDNPTADADVVLCSMGGQPERPEVKRARERRALRDHEEEVDVAVQKEKISSNSSGADADPAASTMRPRQGFTDAEEAAVGAARMKQLERDPVQSTLNTGHD